MEDFEGMVQDVVAGSS